MGVSHIADISQDGQVRVSSCFLMAAMTFGWLVPTQDTAAPPIPSITRRPSSRSTYIPSPWTATGGVHGVLCKIEVVATDIGGCMGVADGKMREIYEFIYERAAK